jgi:hypothetical protein
VNKAELLDREIADLQKAANYLPMRLAMKLTMRVAELIKTKESLVQGSAEDHE